ncbi:hypothetical protein D3C75_998330 [compost metagenome]
MNVVIKGNIATITGLAGVSGIFVKVQELGLSTFSVASTSKAVYDLSFPMTREHHMVFAGQIHRYNAEQRKKNPHLEPRGPSNDPTPPQGGTPGAARTVEFENTLVIAA